MSFPGFTATLGSASTSGGPAFSTSPFFSYPDQTFLTTLWSASASAGFSNSGAAVVEIVDGSTTPRGPPPMSASGLGFPQLQGFGQQQPSAANVFGASSGASFHGFQFESGLSMSSSAFGVTLTPFFSASSFLSNVNSSGFVVGASPGQEAGLGTILCTTAAPTTFQNPFAFLYAPAAGISIASTCGISSSPLSASDL